MMECTVGRSSSNMSDSVSMLGRKKAGGSLGPSIAKLGPLHFLSTQPTWWSHRHCCMWKGRSAKTLPGSSCEEKGEKIFREGDQPLFSSSPTAASLCSPNQHGSDFVSLRKKVPHFAVHLLVDDKTVAGLPVAHLHGLWGSDHMFPHWFRRTWKVGNEVGPGDTWDEGSCPNEHCSKRNTGQEHERPDRRLSISLLNSFMIVRAPLMTEEIYLDLD